jgi:DNA gyrase/topoisomerase IV subunit A
LSEILVSIRSSGTLDSGTRKLEKRLTRRLKIAIDDVEHLQATATDIEDEIGTPKYTRTAIRKSLKREKVMQGRRFNPFTSPIPEGEEDEEDEEDEEAVKVSSSKKTSASRRSSGSARYSPRNSTKGAGRA